MNIQEMLKKNAELREAAVAQWKDYKEHFAIAQAVKNHDSDLAEHLMLQHTRCSFKRLLDT